MWTDVFLYMWALASVTAVVRKLVYHMSHDLMLEADWMTESFDLYMILKREPYEFKIVLVEISGRDLLSDCRLVWEGLISSVLQCCPSLTFDDYLFRALNMNARNYTTVWVCWPWVLLLTLKVMRNFSPDVSAHRSLLFSVLPPSLSAHPPPPLSPLPRRAVKKPTATSADGLYSKVDPKKHTLYHSYYVLKASMFTPVRGTLTP